MQADTNLFGNTRTFVGERHALITPGAHIPSQLNKWNGITPFFLICPPLSKNFQQIQAKVTEKGYATLEKNPKIERFLFVHDDEFTAEFENKKHTTLKKNDYFFLPPNQSAIIKSNSINASFTLFEKIYEPLQGYELPKFQIGSLADVTPEPFMENEKALLQTILPTDNSYDMGVSYFRYDPGATLPLVETHIMEHGLIMTEGQGIYRLEDKYYPVQVNDVIWMAPFCPQWFVAMGDIHSAYLYYKNVNRSPI